MGQTRKSNNRWCIFWTILYCITLVSYIKTHTDFRLIIMVGSCIMISITSLRSQIIELEEKIRGR